MERYTESSLGAVLWDMDGVLVDSIDLHYLSWSTALGDFGIPLTRQEFLKFFGLSSAEVAERLIGPEVKPAMQADIRRHKDMLFEQLAPQLARPMPGALELVRRFSGHLLQAVASSATLHQVTLMLDIIGAAGYFQAVVTSSDAPGKPDPAIFQIAASRFDIAPTSCLVIEDSPSGIEAARRAGMPVIAVCTTHPAESLAGADLILSALTQLSVVQLQALFSTIPKMLSLSSNEIVHALT